MDYHIGRDGRRFGPYPEERVAEMIRAGELSPQDLGWHEGLPEWRPLAHLFPIAFPPGAADPSAAENPFPDGRALPAFAPDGARFRDAFAPAPCIVTPAGRGTRLCAVLIDLAILGSPILLLAGPDVMRAMRTSGAPDTILVPLFLFMAAITAIVLVQAFFLTRDGQSLGKKALGLRIVGAEDDRPPGFVRTVILRVLAHGFLVGIPGLGQLYFVADSLAIFSEDRRCIHDHLAGTRVVAGSRVSG